MRSLRDVAGYKSALYGFRPPPGFSSRPNLGHLLRTPREYRLVVTRDYPTRRRGRYAGPRREPKARVAKRKHDRLIHEPGTITGQPYPGQPQLVPETGDHRLYEAAPVGTVTTGRPNRTEGRCTATLTGYGGPVRAIAAAFGSMQALWGRLTGACASGTSGTLAALRPGRWLQ